MDDCSARPTKRSWEPISTSSTPTPHPSLVSATMTATREVGVTVKERFDGKGGKSAEKGKGLKGKSKGEG